MNTIITVEKIRDYCLNEDHPRGKYKARVFKSVLKIERKDAEYLRKLILKIVNEHEVVETFRDDYGVRHYVDFRCYVNDRSSLIRTYWISKYSEKFPRFVSCYIIRGK